MRNRARLAPAEQRLKLLLGIGIPINRVIAVNTTPLSRPRNRSIVPSDKRTSSAPFPNRR